MENHLLQKAVHRALILRNAIQDKTRNRSKALPHSASVSHSPFKINLAELVSMSIFVYLFDGLYRL